MDRNILKYKHTICFLVGLYCGYYIVYRLSESILRKHIENCSRLNMHSTQEVTSEAKHQDPKDKFLLVAVMTTRKYLKTRAEAIYRTWGQRVPGRIVFFVGGTEAYDGHLPVIILNNITENAYPPQKKSFAMLEYVSTHFVDEYEWFMRADDDVFLKTDKIETLLRKVNSSQTLYIGQPGTGTQAEAGKLGLHNSAPYCMGGPGVFFTRSALKKIKGHLAQCLVHAVTLHEDTELGRCVQIHAGIACSNAFEFAQLFYQNYRNKSGSFAHKLGKAEGRAITLHPIKDHHHMFRLDNHFSLTRLKKLKLNIKKLLAEVLLVNDLLNNDVRSQTNKQKASEIRNRLRELDSRSGISFPNQDSSGRSLESEVWDYVQNNDLYSTDNMFQKPTSDFSNQGRDLSYSKSLNFVRSDSRFSKRKLGCFTFLYQRPSYGRVLENIFLFQHYEKSVTASVRTVQLFASAQVQTELESPKSGAIHIILALFQRSSVFSMFMSNLTHALNAFDGYVGLTVVLYTDSSFEYKKSQRTASSYNKFRNKLTVKVLLVSGTFSRARAISTGVRNIADDALLLIMDVDMLFGGDFLNRVVLNTKLTKQAYFPIFFSQYNPKVICFDNRTCDTKTVDFGTNSGTWRYFSYGIVSIYKSDLVKVKGYRVDINGWGKEDVDFYEKCLRSSLDVFRVADPSLIHQYHNRDCSTDLAPDQLVMCEQSRYQLYGSEHSLFNIIKKIHMKPFK